MSMNEKGNRLIAGNLSDVSGGGGGGTSVAEKRLPVKEMSPIDLPDVAMSIEKRNAGGGGECGVTTPLPESPSEKEAMMRAAAVFDKLEIERRETHELLAKAEREVKNAKRENDFLTLELATIRNNLSAMGDQCEALRQEASDMRALFSLIRAQLDHFEIPLPVRKKAKNGVK